MCSGSAVTLLWLCSDIMCSGSAVTLLWLCCDTLHWLCSDIVYCGCAVLTLWRKTNSWSLKETRRGLPFSRSVLGSVLFFMLVKDSPPPPTPLMSHGLSQSMRDILLNWPKIEVPCTTGDVCLGPFQMCQVIVGHKI